MLFFMTLLIPVAACRVEQSEVQYLPEIISPREGAYFFPGEAVRVEVDIEPGAGYDYLEVYIDEAFLFETDPVTIDTLIRNRDFQVGHHVLKVKSIDVYGNVNEASVGFQVTFSLVEPEDEVTFNEGQSDAWFLSNWSVDPSTGYDDSHSLHSSSGDATAIVRKQFNESGSIGFHVMNGKENLEFLVDGEVKARWFGKDEWGYYAYSIPKGDHVFKWFSITGETYIDKIEFTTGTEQHTPGELYGGGTIYYLDSTGLHGLIAARTDGVYGNDYEIPWGCYGLQITTGNRATSKSDGEGNTLAIVSDCNLDHIAARYCYDLSISEDTITWDDWYLPAVDELFILYKNRDKLKGLRGQYYWSSTSYSATAASVINFSDGKHHGANRNIPHINGPSAVVIYVRAVRKF